MRRSLLLAAACLLIAACQETPTQLLDVDPALASANGGQPQAATYDELRDLVFALEGDFEKCFNRENQAACTRVAAGMDELIVLARETHAAVHRVLHSGPQKPHYVPPLGGMPWESLRDLVAAMESDWVKYFEKGNQAAGARVLTDLQDLQRFARDVKHAVR